ncbi:hypothetical protein HHK36_010097 [Tetracentron sinense]|uniref:DUF7086 domain-containing protein n=1 Tax=Tetracentron sinense TaxID=13715 RepID=A0A835DM06_TETSI|nr:hypothetical protein HHK36_010097 [Tetracentron sinense]
MEEEDDPLALCLSPPNKNQVYLQSPPLLPPPPEQTPPSLLQLHTYVPSFIAGSSTSTYVPSHEPSPTGEPAPSRPLHTRRNPTQFPRDGKGDTVPVPFPWATDHRATVHNLHYLLSHGLSTITGDVQCKECERQYQIEFDLEKRFREVVSYIVANNEMMYDRAPSVWMNPILPNCSFCEKMGCVKPIMPLKKKTINWLFLFLGQMLGCCTLDHLKYFCKHTKNHRTGAKDRVLYLTYLNLCKQLDPEGLFARILCLKEHEATQLTESEHDTVRSISVANRTELEHDTVTESKHENVSKPATKSALLMEKILEDTYYSQ